jgi:hypothetical protein
MRSGAATTVRSMCWTMCQEKKIDASPSIGGPSAAMRAPSPRKKSAVRQKGHDRRIRRTPIA